jgi:uncharacterized phage infection (PIP) family protein YhgE
VVFSRDLKKRIEELNREVALLKSQLGLVTRDRDTYKELAQTWGGRTQQIVALLDENTKKLKTLADGQKELKRTMSEQFDQLNQGIGEVESAVTNLTQAVSSETQQVIAELERLNNQNPAIDLGPAIARLQGVRTTVDQAATNIGNIIADVVPEPPTPEPAPAPNPEPGRGRR